ncbi:MAG: ABC transporter ATP-binding protein [Phycisphaeraceae bacterium]|nr:ABC transporter ATP-binding protein [Phycisphaeraceae bacterium]
MLAIDAHELRRVYPARRRSPARTALGSVSLRVEQGAFLALLGPNGSGKSTLLRILATLDAPDSGSLALFGAPPSGALREVRAALGVVFQRPALDPLLTVRENLVNHAALFGMRAGDAKAAALASAARLRVEDRLHDRVGTLSGGLQRRVDLARAFLSAPRLLLLDEPTTGLDPHARASFLDALETLRRETGAAIVLSTHLMDEAERADRVVLLADGAIVGDDAPGALRASLGGAVLRLSPQDGAPLEGLPLRVLRRDRELIASGASDDIAHAASELATRGVPFAFGPPTLGDVYSARAGRSLHDDANRGEPAP